LDRRFLLAPDAIELDRAYNAALEGSIGATPIAELVFPSCVAPALAPEGCATASILLHPVADRPLADESWSRAVEASARAAFDRVVPGAHTQIVAVEIESAVGALPPTLSAIERRKQLTETSGVEGYFFCGPESAIGRSESLSPGRRAAERAIRYFRDAGSAR
jgi:phytoene dehydrogenase-like protein